MPQEEAAEARLLRFVTEYVATGGNKAEAAKRAGSIANGARNLARAGSALYKKAITRGLLRTDYVEPEEELNKEGIIALLGDQATGKRPSRRYEVRKRNKDGVMVTHEIRNEYDELGAQDKLAKVMGLYEEVQTAPPVNILQIIGSLGEAEKKTAESYLIEAHSKLLEGEVVGSREA